MIERMFMIKVTNNIICPCSESWPTKDPFQWEWFEYMAYSLDLVPIHFHFIQELRKVWEENASISTKSFKTPWRHLYTLVITFVWRGYWKARPLAWQISQSSWWLWQKVTLIVLESQQRTMILSFIFLLCPVGIWKKNTLRTFIEKQHTFVWMRKLFFNHKIARLTWASN